MSQTPVARRWPSAVLMVLSLAFAALALPAQRSDAVPFSPTIDVQILTVDTEEPMAIAVADDGRVLFTERQGGLNVILRDGTQIEAARLDVSGNLCTFCSVQDDNPLEEGGLYGILLAQDFNTSNELYLYRAIPFSRDPDTLLGTWRLSKFFLDPTTNLLDLDSEETILEVPAHWDHCCHYGGDMDWLPDGTMLLSVGDDIPASSSGGYGPRDNTETWLDGELYVQNPADRRGKILRLMPDGSVPDGSQPGIEPNPWVGKSMFHPYIEANPVDDPLRPWIRSETGSEIEFDPYVYAIGFKQPFKGAVHGPTGTSYYADVGPDASSDDPERGPQGYDERNTVPFLGGTNHGWPRCAGPNIPYNDVDWVNGGVNNGLLDCSGMEPATFYYTNEASDEWPDTGTGAKTGLPVAFYDADVTGALRIPEFENTLIDLEWSRDWFSTFDVNEDGTFDPDTFERWDPFLSTTGGLVFQLQGPIDAAIGPDGAVYVAEYGKGFYFTPISRIIRVQCFGCTPDDADYVISDGDDAPAPAPEPEPAPDPEPEPGPAVDDDELPATGNGYAALASMILGLSGVASWRRNRIV